MCTTLRCEIILEAYKLGGDTWMVHVTHVDKCLKPMSFCCIFRENYMLYVII